MRTRTALVFAAGWALAGCDLGRYPALGEHRDETRVLGPNATTWVAFGSQEVTVLVLGAPGGDPTAGPPGFSLSRFRPGESDRAWSGTYELDATSSTLTLSETLSFLSDSGTSAAGNERTPIDTRVVYSVALADGRLSLTGQPSIEPLENFQSLATRLDPHGAVGALCAIELLELTSANAELRMPGFGGTGTVQYTRPSDFRGILRGTVRFSLDDLLSPVTEFVFSDFSDFSGYTVNGTKATHTDIGGNGFIYGALRFSIAPSSLVIEPDAGTPPVLSGSVTYGTDDTHGLRLDNGNETGGTYSVTFDGGGTYPVSYAAPAAVHLSTCFDGS